MIHAARKLFALLLIAAFTTAFAQPLVWCVSGSDHSRIEFKIGGNGHGASPSENASKQLTGCVNPGLKHVGEDCIDSDAFPEAAESSGHDLAATVAPASDPLQWLISPPARAPALPATVTALPEPPPFQAAATQLDHIRTVVLLT